MVRGQMLAMAMLLAVAVPRAEAQQSLGEIARQDEARRARIRQPARVYTNADLKPEYAPPPEPAADAPVTQSADAVDRAAPAAQPAADSETARADDGNTPRDEQEPQRSSDRGEDYWRGRAEAIRSRMAAKNREVDVLRQRLASLESINDPERAIAAQALSRAVSDLEAFNQEWVRFETLARESGVPMTWIR